MGPRAKFQTQLRNKEKEVWHLVDQLKWFPSALDYGEAPQSVSRTNMVHFNFPHSQGNLSGAAVYVVGKYTECEAYFSSFDSSGRPKLWKVFAYGLGEKPGKFIGPSKEPVEREFGHFTTEICPFLYEGGLPENFLRTFSFPLFGSESLEVKARRGESSKEDIMTLSFLPDSRHGRPQEFLKIARTQDLPNDNRWYSPQLE